MIGKLNTEEMRKTMTELTGDEYKTWQQNMTCRACDSSDLMLLEPSEMARGYYPSPRQEEWECTACLTRHVDTINIKMEWSKRTFLYDREASRVTFMFERTDASRLELVGVNHAGVMSGDPRLVAFPSFEDFPTIDAFFRCKGAGDAAMYGYVEVGENTVKIYGDNDDVIGALTINTVQ